MFSLGGTEFVLIVVVALLLFGPDKIPQLARTIGRFTREFNKYRDIMESTVRQEIARHDAEPEMSTEDRMAKAAAASGEIIAAREAASAGDDESAEPAAGASSGALLAVTDESDEEDEG